MVFVKHVCPQINIPTGSKLWTVPYTGNCVAMSNYTLNIM